MTSEVPSPHSPPIATPNSAAQNQEHGQVRRERRRGADDGIAEDVEHQRRLAAELVAEPAEHEGADEAHRQRQEQRVGDRGDVDAELLGDVLDDEGQQEEIEGVERPAEIGRDDRLCSGATSGPSILPPPELMKPPLH